MHCPGFGLVPVHFHLCKPNGAGRNLDRLLRLRDGDHATLSCKKSLEALSQKSGEGLAWTTWGRKKIASDIVAKVEAKYPDVAAVSVRDVKLAVIEESRPTRTVLPNGCPPGQKWHGLVRACLPGVYGGSRIFSMPNILEPCRIGPTGQLILLMFGYVIRLAQSAGSMVWLNSTQWLQIGRLTGHIL